MTIAFDTQTRTGFGYASSADSRSAVASRGKSVTVLTPRGRFVIGLLVSLVVGLGGVALGSTVAATQDSGSVQAQAVVVQPGDTLWAIATSANPGGDIRKTIDEIIRLNALELGQPLPVGVQLSVPIYE